MAPLPWGSGSGADLDGSPRAQAQDAAQTFQHGQSFRSETAFTQSGNLHGTEGSGAQEDVTASALAGTGSG